MRDELVKVREKVKKDLPEPSPIVKGERRKVPAKRQMWTEEEAEELLRKADRLWKQKMSRKELVAREEEVI